MELQGTRQYLFVGFWLWNYKAQGNICLWVFGYGITRHKAVSVFGYGITRHKAVFVKLTEGKHFLQN
jgi:hypothetical protein